MEGRRGEGGVFDGRGCLLVGVSGPNCGVKEARFGRPEASFKLGLSGASK